LLRGGTVLLASGSRRREKNGVLIAAANGGRAGYVYRVARVTLLLRAGYRTV